MAFLEMLDFKKIRRGLVCLAFILICLGLQNMLLARVSLWGVHALFLPSAALALGFFLGGVHGAAYGLVLGWLADLSSLDSTVTYMVLYAFLGFIGGFLTEFVINRRFFSYMLLSAAALFATAFCQALPLWAFRSTPLGALLPTMLLQTLLSLPFAAAVYFAAKAIAAKRREN